MYALCKLGYVALYLYVALCAEYVGYVKLCRAVARFAVRRFIVVIVYLACENGRIVAGEGYVHYRRKLFYIQRAVHRKAEPLGKRYIVLRPYSFEKCFKTRFVKGEAECYKFIFKDIFYSVQHVIEVEELAVYGRS